MFWEKLSFCSCPPRGWRLPVDGWWLFSSFCLFLQLHCWHVSHFALVVVVRKVFGAGQSAAVTSATMLQESREK